MAQVCVFCALAVHGPHRQLAGLFLNSNLLKVSKDHPTLYFVEMCRRALLPLPVVPRVRRANFGHVDTIALLNVSVHYKLIIVARAASAAHFSLAFQDLHRHGTNDSPADLQELPGVGAAYVRQH